MPFLQSLLLRALNHLIQGSPWAAERLRPFAGQQVRIDGTPLPVLLAIAGDGHFAPGDEAADAAVTITLPPDFAFRLLVDREQLFASARLAGTADLAETLAFVFRHLRWDVEADLARVVGDIAAHRLVRTGRGVLHWQQDAQARLWSNVAEYLSEEQRLLATPADIEAFARDVATLRDDVARLEKRLQALASR